MLKNFWVIIFEDKLECKDIQSTDLYKNSLYIIDDVWLAAGAVSEFCVQILQMSSDLSSNAFNKEHADPLWLYDGRCQVTVVKKIFPPKNVTYKGLLFHGNMARCHKYKYLNIWVFS